jgi:hypothetical protein
VIPIDSELGELHLDETLLFYDTPVLFTCRDRLNHAYLAVAIDQDDSSEVFLYLPISEDRLTSLRTGWVSLNNVMEKPEADDAYVVRVGMGGVPDSVQRIRATEIDDAWYPTGVLTLDEAVDTAYPFSASWLRGAAERQQRPLTAFEFDIPEMRRTEAPLGEIAAVMNELQELTTRLTVPDSNTLLDVQGQSELGFVQLQAASFVLIVAPYQPNTLFQLPTSPMNRIAGLFDSAASSDESFAIAVANMPMRTATHMRNFLESISDMDAAVIMLNATPGEEVRTASLGRERIRAGIDVLRARRDLEPAQYVVTGHLLALNHVKGTFLLQADRPVGRARRPKRYSGKFDGQLLAELDGFESGKSPLYRCTLIEEKDVSVFVGERRPKSHIRMVSIERLQSLDDDSQNA